MNDVLERPNYTDTLIQDCTNFVDITARAFHDQGIDADIIATELKTNRTLYLQKSKQLERVIHKIGYKGDSDQMRVQKIVNASILELFLLKYLSDLFGKTNFTRKSGGFYNGHTENGVDFNFNYKETSTDLEAKVYGSLSSMQDFQTNNSWTFHKADLVCCYVLATQNHWQWLYRAADGAYYNLNRNPSFILENLPKLEMCEVTELEDSFKITLDHRFN